MVTMTAAPVLADRHKPSAKADSLFVDGGFTDMASAETIDTMWKAYRA